MSADGIPLGDWGRVQELAVKAASAMQEDDPERCQARADELLSELRQLKGLYGDLPSILDMEHFEAEFLDLLRSHNEWRKFFEK